VLDCLAPWSPEINKLAPGCKVIQAGPDPLYTRFPVRNFQADLSLAGETADLILGLARAMQPHLAARSDERSARRDRVAATAENIRTTVRRDAEKGGEGELMTKAWVSLCLSRAIEGRDATVLSELGCPFDPLTLRTPGSWYQEPHSGGLGWSMPCALGMQLAQPDRLVIATMGDGSYMFANPVACHQIAEAMNLPILVLVLNNREWGAVRKSVLGTYPDGYASRTNQMPLVSLDPTPDFTKVAAASRAWTAAVDAPADLPGVLAAAIEHITTNRTQALVEIRVAPG
jgi:acetolactate synthase I/II/III large subunit